MRFKLTLITTDKNAQIPINYQYPLSAAIYKILAKGDDQYANFLHEKGYGKGYKFFTFSDLKLRYKRESDRLVLTESIVSVMVCFHLPQASQSFIEGLFRTETIIIADKNSKASFMVQSVEALTNPLNDLTENQIAPIIVRPCSAVVAGSKDDKGNYSFHAPDDPAFTGSLIHNWRNKISACWDEETGSGAILLMEIGWYDNPYRSRLVTIKDGSMERTQIKGFLNFKLKLTAEKRFLDLIMNAGLGLYSAQGMGCVERVGK